MGSMAEPVTVTVSVPVAVRVTVTRTVEVTVPVEQSGDIDPSPHGDWPDVTALYQRAQQMIHDGEGRVLSETVRVEGWQAPPSQTGDPYWRPVMFGGRIG